MKPDELIQVIRDDPWVGRGSGSIVDLGMSDEGLIDELQSCGCEAFSEALELAYDLHGCWLQSSLRLRPGKRTDAEKEIMRLWEAGGADRSIRIDQAADYIPSAAPPTEEDQPLRERVFEKLAEIEEFDMMSMDLRGTVASIVTDLIETQGENMQMDETSVHLPRPE